MAQGSRKESASKLAEDPKLHERARVLKLKQMVEARSQRCPRTERVQLTLQSLPKRQNEAQSRANEAQLKGKNAQMRADQAGQTLTNSQ